MLVSVTVGADGTQSAELRIDADKNTDDKSFKCKVKSSAFADSPESEVTAPINIYGELLQALDLST